MNACADVSGYGLWQAFSEFAIMQRFFAHNTPGQGKSFHVFEDIHS